MYVVSNREGKGGPKSGVEAIGDTAANWQFLNHSQVNGRNPTS